MTDDSVLKNLIIFLKHEFEGQLVVVIIQDEPMDVMFITEGMRTRKQTKLSPYPDKNSEGWVPAKLSSKESKAPKEIDGWMDGSMFTYFY